MPVPSKHSYLKWLEIDRSIDTLVDPSVHFIFLHLIQAAIFDISIKFDDTLKCFRPRPSPMGNGSDRTTFSTVSPIMPYAETLL